MTPLGIKPTLCSMLSNLHVVVANPRSDNFIIKFNVTLFKKSIFIDQNVDAFRILLQEFLNLSIK